MTIVASLGSLPKIASQTIATSSTVFANGPTWSSDDANATTPHRGTRPYVGFIPTTPVSAAGWRIEPPVSVPSAKRTSPAATATADPPDEPPGTRSSDHGFFTGPNAEFSFELPIANSSRFVFPTMTAPCASRRSTTVAEYAGMYPSRMREPAVVGIFFVPMMSLHAHGMPVSGGASPALSRASAARACARAWSSERCSHALFRSACDRWSASSASSSALILRARRSSPASRIDAGRSVKVVPPIPAARGRTRHRGRPSGALASASSRETRPDLVLPHHVRDR